MMKQLLVLIAAVTLVAVACSSDRGADSVSGASGPLPASQSQAGPPVDFELPPQVATAADLAAAESFLRRQDLPNEPTTMMAVSYQVLAGLCTESFGVKVVGDRADAIKSGLFTFWLGDDFEFLGLAERAGDACERSLQSLGAVATRDRELEVLYELRLDEHECLAGNGLPTSEPPPPKEFYKRPIWSPWESLTGAAVGAPELSQLHELPGYADALEVCPRTVN